MHRTTAFSVLMFWHNPQELGWASAHLLVPGCASVSYLFRKKFGGNEMENCMSCVFHFSVCLMFFPPRPKAKGWVRLLARLLPPVHTPESESIVQRHCVCSKRVPNLSGPCVHFWFSWGGFSSENTFVRKKASRFDLFPYFLRKKHTIFLPIFGKACKSNKKYFRRLCRHLKGKNMRSKKKRDPACAFKSMYADLCFFIHPLAVK